jgi:hypothetical protein
MSVPPPPPRRARPGSTPADATAPIGPPPLPAQRSAPELAIGQAVAEAPLSTQVVVAPPETRAQRQPQNQPAPRSGAGRRWGFTVLAVLGAVVVAAALFFVLKKDSNEKSGPELEASTAVNLRPGALKVDAVGFSNDFPVEAQHQVLATLGAYVDAGIVAPLRKGKANDASLAAAFDPAAIARLVGTERATVLDENLPKVEGKITVKTPPVPISALADGDGKIVLVSTDVRFSVKARSARGAVEINHTGSFVFAPDANGAWRITGWTLSTDRGGPGVPPASTPASDTKTTTVNP